VVVSDVFIRQQLPLGPAVERRSSRNHSLSGEHAGLTKQCRERTHAIGMRGAQDTRSRDQDNVPGPPGFAHRGPTRLPQQPLRPVALHRVPEPPARHNGYPRPRRDALVRPSLPNLGNDPRAIEPPAVLEYLLQVSLPAETIQSRASIWRAPTPGESDPLPGGGAGRCAPLRSSFEREIRASAASGVGAAEMSFSLGPPRACRKAGAHLPPDHTALSERRPAKQAGAMNLGRAQSGQQYSTGPRPAASAAPGRDPRPWVADTHRP